MLLNETSFLLWNEPTLPTSTAQHKWMTNYRLPSLRSNVPFPAWREQLVPLGRTDMGTARFIAKIHQLFRSSSVQTKNVAPFITNGYLTRKNITHSGTNLYGTWFPKPWRTGMWSLPWKHEMVGPCGAFSNICNYDSNLDTSCFRNITFRYTLASCLPEGLYRSSRKSSYAIHRSIDRSNTVLSLRRDTKNTMCMA